MLCKLEDDTALGGLDWLLFALHACNKCCQKNSSTSFLSSLSRPFWIRHLWKKSHPRGEGGQQHSKTLSRTFSSLLTWKLCPACSSAYYHHFLRNYRTTAHMKKRALTQRKPGRSSKKTEKGTWASSPFLQKAMDCLETSVARVIGEGHDSDRAAAQCSVGAPSVTDVKYCL